MLPGLKLLRFIFFFNVAILQSSLLTISAPDFSFLSDQPLGRAAHASWRLLIYDMRYQQLRSFFACVPIYPKSAAFSFRFLKSLASQSQRRSQLGVLQAVLIITECVNYSRFRLGNSSEAPVRMSACKFDRFDSFK